ncbi:hypothetical protein PR202_gb06921 [Eleusine coracana subsp. coracana]|uniref:F-box domain-containing protein n=1 Tax=Eleusine coracana subsp. coracana TaxID=191504 RepID=A0AAV5EAX0_ELECO|nr:hypothetical protein PR202_gb06921 [Eleusine coracana subsp. coracana]
MNFRSIRFPCRAGDAPTQAAAKVAAWVLDDDDLLREILLRLDFPSCLVRAAAVSKRWLRHASDPAFLRRFRCLHPPRLLGLYVCPMGPISSGPHQDLFPDSIFVPMPQSPAESAAVIRRGSFHFHLEHDIFHNSMWDCRNGRLIIDSYMQGYRGNFVQPSASCAIHQHHHCLPRPRDP